MLLSSVIGACSTLKTVEETLYLYFLHGNVLCCFKSGRINEIGFNFLWLVAGINQIEVVCMRVHSSMKASKSELGIHAALITIAQIC
jgi:hypothetical protein